MRELKPIAQKLLLASLVCLALGFIYAHFQLQEDLKEYSPFETKLSEAKNADVLYLGDCSDGYTAKGEQAAWVSSFLNEMMPQEHVVGLSDNGFQANTFLQLLEILDAQEALPKTVIVTVNLRAFASHIYHDHIYTPTIQQQLLLRNPSLPAFANRGILTFNSWKNLRKHDLAPFIERDARRALFEEQEENKITLQQWKRKYAQDEIALSYLRDFGFELDKDHPRLKDFEAIVALAQKKEIDLWFHWVPVNYAVADSLIGLKLTSLIQGNTDFLLNRFNALNVQLINNTYSCSAEDFSHTASNSHFKPAGKRKMAKAILDKLKGNP